VRMRSSHARRFVPGVYDRHDRNARAYVSCTSSSASSREFERCRATRYTWSERPSASSSKRTRSRASAAMPRAFVSGVISATAATVLQRTGPACDSRKAGYVAPMGELVGENYGDEHSDEV